MATGKGKKTQKPEEESESPAIFNISRENGSFKLTRRDFIKAAAATSAATLIAGCVQPQKRDVVEVAATNPSEQAPTKTPMPTRTSRPTTTPTPTPIVVTAIVKAQGINLRTGPGTNYRAIGTLAANVPLSVIGKSQDGTWLKVLVKVKDLPNLAGAPITENGSVTEIEGWIRTDLVEVKTGSLDDLPVEAAPPTPTPLPNQQPTGDEGINYQYTDLYGETKSYTLPCGSPIPEGAVCSCNCVAVCSCNGYTAPSCSCVADMGDMICTCDVVSYWYPN
ncbi:MAG: SH3 domain-containing protein [Anaerolineaceae bacterium]